MFSFDHWRTKMSDINDLTNTQEEPAFKNKMRVFAIGSLILLLLGIALAIITKITNQSTVIGWGISLGVPLSIGFYMGLFSLIFFEEGKPQKFVNWCKVFKVFFFLWLLATLGFGGFFIVDAFISKNQSLAVSFKAGLNGLFCGSTFSLIFFLPTVVGVSLAFFMGKITRLKFLKNQALKNSLLSLALLACLGLPSVLELIENHLGGREHLASEKILTVRKIAASSHDVWKKLQFYEDTGSESSLLFLLNFPKPMYTKGEIKKVGDITTCVYDRGYLVKRTTKIHQSLSKSYLEFDVIEQVNIENKAITLTSGSFTLENLSLEEGSMKLELRTNYKPKLTPRWIWRPLEKIIAGSLHGHVVDKIERDLVSQKEKAGLAFRK